MSSRADTRMMNSTGSESKERRNYITQGVDQTIWSGGDLKPGDTMNLTPTQALNDDFENYETKFWKPYIEKAIIKGQHRWWALSKVIDTSLFKVSLIRFSSSLAISSQSIIPISQ